MFANWLRKWSRNMEFEVTHKLFTEKFLVDLVVESCTSNFRGLVGIPCQHVRYGHSISPINGHKMWPTTEYTEILPPKHKKGPKAR